MDKNNIKEINLKLDTKFTHIAGNDFGYKIYLEQVEKFFDGETKLLILFPKYIEGVSISFVQGLIKDMVKEIGKEKLLSLIELKSDNPSLNKRLEENLKF